MGIDVNILYHSEYYSTELYQIYIKCKAVYKAVVGILLKAYFYGRLKNTTLINILGIPIEYGPNSYS